MRPTWPIAPALAYLLLGATVGAQGYSSETRARDADGEEVSPGGPRTVVDLDDNAESGASLADALDRAPSVEVARSGATGAPAFLSIRGSAPYQVALSLDGVPLNGAQNSSFDLSMIPVELLGRATVYRAMVPVQLGRPLPGGAVALETRFSDPGAQVFLGAGSWAARRAGFALNGRGARNDWMLAAVYSGANNAFRFFDDAGTPLNLDDDAETERINAHADSAGLLWRHRIRVGDWRLTTVALANGGAQGIPGLGSDQAESTQLDRGRVFAALSARNRQLADGRIHVETLVGGSTEWQRFRDPEDELGLGDDDDRERTLLSILGLRPSCEFHEALVARTVLDWTHERYRAGGQGTTRDAIATGAELELDPLDQRIVVEAGARADTSFTREDSASSTSHTGVSPRAGLLVEPWTDHLWSVRGTASVGSAERVPGFFELYGDSGSVVGNDGLRPERRTGYDLGLQFSAESALDAGTVHGALTYGFFDRRIDDLITFVQTGLGVAVAQNVADAAIRGHEIAFLGGLRDRVDLHGNYSVIDALDRSVEPSAQLPGRPVHTYAGGIDLRHLWVSIGWEVEGNGEFFVDRIEARPMPARARHDLSLDLMPPVRWEPRINVRVENVADQRAERVSLPDGGATVEVPRAVADFVGQPLPGRAAFVTLSVSYAEGWGRRER